MERGVHKGRQTLCVLGTKREPERVESVVDLEDGLGSRCLDPE